MTPLSSSNLSGYDYNPGNQTLVIYFHGGRPYTYKQVPDDIASGLASASSAGRYFNENIKNIFDCSPGNQLTQGYEEKA
jgi:hypothetical protein